MRVRCGRYGESPRTGAPRCGTEQCGENRMNLARKRVGILLVCSIWFVISVQPQTKSTGPPPTPEEAKKYLENAEQDLFDLSIKASRTGWVQENFITIDTQSIAADANEAVNTAATKYAKQAHR